MVNQFMVTPRASTNEKPDVHGYVKSPNKRGARLHLCLFLENVERQDTYVLTDGVQVVLSTCIRRTDQDWSKYLPIYKSFSAF